MGKKTKTKTTKGKKKKKRVGGTIRMKKYQNLE
jgi:hypothetical protein